LLYAPADLLAHPVLLFKVWEGGMASHGGFAGVAVALAWFARRHHISFFHLSDLVASVTALGLLLGRIANFINGELWGQVSTVSWAVIFPASERPGTPFDLIAPRHPSQLYAAALEGAVLLAYAQWRLWCTPVLRNHPGRLAGEFLIGYAVMRTVTEIFREPDASLILGLSRGTFFSFFILLGGLAFYLRPSRRLAPVAPHLRPPTKT
jgi:phosphatidylglycerol:prolipoprotein diacylglycerol transferase